MSFVFFYLDRKKIKRQIGREREELEDEERSEEQKREQEVNYTVTTAKNVNGNPTRSAWRLLQC